MSRVPPTELVVRTDSPDVAYAILMPLEYSGAIVLASLEELPEGLPTGLRLEQDGDDECAWSLHRAVESEIRNSGAVAPAYRLHRGRFCDDASFELTMGFERYARLTLPLAGADSRELMERILACRGSLELTLYTADPSRWSSLVSRLRVQGFRVVAKTVADDRAPQIMFGGAPEEIIDEIEAHVVVAAPEIRLARDRAWDEVDCEVCLWLPTSGAPHRSCAFVNGRNNEDRAIARSVFGRRHQAHGRSVVELGEDRVRIGAVELPVRGEAEACVPPRERFRHLCIDEPTAHSLEFLAESSLLGEPALLTGSTGAGKSEIAAYLCGLIRQPHLRMGFGPDTDADALVGRYQPTADVGELAAFFEHWRDHVDALDPRTVALLACAAREGRVLDPLEVHLLHRFEHVRSSPFRWSDGLAVTALRRGGMLVLDELNLAPTEAVERLNPLLELPPTFVLTEKGGDVFGPGGEPIDPGFRVVATRNPSGYAGRQPLSQALLSRFSAQRVVPDPGEREYEQMLRCLAFGEQPEIELGGVAYAAWSCDPDPRFAGLAAHADMLPELARFHASMEQANMAEAGAEGAPPVTRRTLRMVAAYVAGLGGEPGSEARRVLCRALVRYYVQPAPPEARGPRLDLLRAFGFSGGWDLP